MSKSNAALSLWVGRIQTDASYPIPPMPRELIADLWAESGHLAQRRERIDKQLEQTAKSDELARLGIGPASRGPVVRGLSDLPAGFGDAPQKSP